MGIIFAKGYKSAENKYKKTVEELKTQVSELSNQAVALEKISREVDKNNKKIIVHMPKAEILSHEIDEDSVETLDQKDGLFNKIKVEDVREFDSKSKEAMEERAIENGLLDKASKNAEKIIEKLVNNDAVQELGYNIEFEESK